MGNDGSDLGSVTLAVADLKAIDARLTALGAADPPIESDGADLTAKIRESQALVRTAIALLTGAERTGEAAANEAPDQSPGTAKRRVKIKAASGTTAASASAHTETAAPSGRATSKTSAKATARGGDRTRSVAASAAATAESPRNSLLARLGAAAAEPDARRNDVADPSGPTSTLARAPGDPTTLDAAERLARLEAEIESLTEAAITGGRRSKAMAADAPAPPAAIKVTEAQASARVAAAPAPLKDHRSGDVGGITDDDDDAEIVIVTSEAKTSGAAGSGTPATRQSPRVFRDPPPGDEDDADVEIVQPGADGRDARLSTTPDSGHTRAGAGKPAAPAKWRLFRGSR